eukprot:2953008-Alexandrium_andersonii.AAC.1
MRSREFPPRAPHRARPTTRGRAPQVANATADILSTRSVSRASRGSAIWASTSPRAKTGRPPGG